MPVGGLGVASNGVFTESNTDPIPGGRLWPDAALTWNAMRAAYVRGGGRGEDFEPLGPQSSARGIAAQRHFYANQPPAAAFPGTSNHGWGLAVDVKTRQAAAWIVTNGHRFGWSWDEGRRVGEWWHFRYVGASKALLKRLRAAGDRWHGYTSSEKRWIVEYDRLLRSKTGSDRRKVLRTVMRAQRKRIWKAAQSRENGGDGRGWKHANRRARYESLLARTR